MENLRKSVLKKQILCDSLNGSLNQSAYESAAEDNTMHDTLYYSFNECENSLSIAEHSNSISSQIDKENTIVMRYNSKEIIDKTLNSSNDESPSSSCELTKISFITTDQMPKISVSVCANPNEIDIKSKFIDEKIETTTNADEPENSQSVEDTFEVCNATVKDENESRSAQSNDDAQKLQKDGPMTEQKPALKIPEIVITEAEDEPASNILQDPNEKKVNPFTAPLGDVNASKSKPTAVAKTRLMRRSIAVNKLPANRVDSTIMRKSLDRKSKAISRLTVSRRSKSPLNLKTIPTKPKVHAKHKCTVDQCSAEFSTIRSLQDHQKSHTISTNFHKCSYCDKTFKLQSALFTHQTDNCLKIPFNEKRKLISRRDRQGSDRRSFIAPAQKMKSPVVRTPATRQRVNDINDTVKKSGIKVFTKKLNCCRCKESFANAFDLAQHIINHPNKKA